MAPRPRSIRALGAGREVLRRGEARRGALPFELLVPCRNRCCSPLAGAGGQLFLINRNSCRRFRADGHNWTKKNDGKTVKETHEKGGYGSIGCAALGIGFWGYWGAGLGAGTLDVLPCKGRLR